MPSADELKSERIHLRLTTLEREQLQILATRQHMSLSEYLRWLIKQEAKKLK